MSVKKAGEKMSKLRWRNDGHLKTFFVFIISNISMRLYTGITNDLLTRTWQHKEKIGARFTAKWDFDRLVYFEEFVDPLTAIAREKEIKGWSRQKKLDLIKRTNPKWVDVTPCGAASEGH